MSKSQNAPERQKSGRRPLLLVAAAVLVVGIVGAVVVFNQNDEPTTGKEPIVIGMQAELSGGFSSWGYWLHKAAVAAVKKVNEEGGIDGRPVKLVVEDTETNPATGVRKLKKLILKDNADFIIGAVHSGVMLASMPVAKEHKRIYVPVGMASEGTGEGSNRYVFRLSTHVREQIAASADWVVNNPEGPNVKKWTTVMTDYQWGWSHEEWFSKTAKESGGEILAQIRIPQGTKDFVPYISKIPKDTEALYFIFFGADSLGFIQQLHDSGYSGKKFTMVCTMEAIDVAKLGAAAEGTWLLEFLPREIKQDGLDSALLATFDTEYHQGFREAVGIDNDGNEVGNPNRVSACSHCWATYEIVHLFKKAVEESGWKGQEDNDKMIRAMEGIQLKASHNFPQGDAYVRKEDHQGFHRHWMSRIVNGRIQVQFEIPMKDTDYPPPIDLSNTGK